MRVVKGLESSKDENIADAQGNRHSVTDVVDLLYEKK